jgi:hypothetical protein
VSDLVEQLRKAERGKEAYAMVKETMERALGDAKEKRGMRGIEVWPEWRSITLP